MDPIQLIRLNNLFTPQNPPTTPGYNPSAPWEHLQGNELFKPQQSTNRMGGMFEAPPIKLETQPTRPAVQDDNDVLSLIERLYKPESTYSDLYQRTLDEMPVRNKPGIGRKIAGSVLGFFGGPQAADMTLYGGYNRKMADWNDKLDALQSGLTAERNTNTNNRQLALQSATAALNERRLGETERKNKAAEELSTRKQELAELKARGYKFEVGEDGYIYGLNPLTGESVRTNVRSRELSLAEAADIKADANIREITERGKIQKELNDADNAAQAAISEARLAQQAELVNLRADIQRQLLEQRYELMGQNKWSNPVQAFDKDGKPLPYFLSINGVTGETKKIDSEAFARVTPPGSGNSSSNNPATMSETQKKQLKINRANEIINKYPQLKNFLQISTSGVNVKPVNTGTAVGKILGGFGNLDAETRQKIVDYIDGKTNVFELSSPANNTAKPAAKPAAQPAKPPVPKGEVLLKKNGKFVGSIKDTPDQLAEAKKQGYEVVR